jgi:CheY-like chemotaxis protein
VLLDMHLSDMDSVEFARQVKNDAHLNGTKLVVMTGDESALDASTAIPLGFSGCLRMPPQPEDLYQRLAGLIDPQEPSHRQRAA